jgi:hypothetical protein
MTPKNGRYQIQTLNNAKQWENTTLASDSAEGMLIRWSWLIYHTDSLIQPHTWDPTQRNDNNLTVLNRALKTYHLDKNPNTKTIRIWDHTANTDYLQNQLKKLQTKEPDLEAYWNKQETTESTKKTLKNAKLATITQIAEQKRKNARRNLTPKTLTTQKDFHALPQQEQDIITEDLQNAYADADIDGHGDEGAGYDMKKFTENLLKLGWVYKPKTK